MNSGKITEHQWPLREGIKITKRFSMISLCQHIIVCTILGSAIYFWSADLQYVNLDTRSQLTDSAHGRESMDIEMDAPSFWHFNLNKIQTCSKSLTLSGQDFCIWVNDNLKQANTDQTKQDFQARQSHRSALSFSNYPDAQLSSHNLYDLSPGLTSIIYSTNNFKTNSKSVS